MVEFDPVVTRREPPPLPPPFVCIICNNTKQPDRSIYGIDERPPMCRACQGHWGRGFGANFQGCTRGERRHMERLAALISAINWQVKNGFRTR